MNSVSPITYTLQSGDGCDVYADLSRCTDAFLAGLDASVMPEVQRFRAFVIANDLEAARSASEYLLELLAIGVLLTQYADHARQSHGLVIGLLTRLFPLRTKYPRLKPAIDRVRGLLLPLLLHEGAGRRTMYSLGQFSRWLGWLDATGEFKEEVIRFRNWQRYFGTLSERQVAETLAMAVAVAEQFREQTKETLGKYTAQVATFLQQQHPAYRGREDFIFCGRSEAEYHLNMVGAEMLNRALRERFARATRRAVLLPTCMCVPGDTGCQARHRGLEITCAACTPSCRVNVLRGMLREAGVETFLIPHSSSFSRFLEQWKDEKSIALVGVACVLNLLTGGYEMIKLGIASQCVFLDYCGCQKHWHPQGIPTDLNARQLLRLLATDHPERPS